MGKIVYAEDDPIVRMALLAALEDAGFEVCEVSDGDSAIEILRKETSSVAGLVTDINLGMGADGWEVARLGRELNPTLPVVYLSAQSHDAWAAKGLPNSSMIAKPFAPTQVVVALSLALNISTDSPKATDVSD